MLEKIREKKPLVHHLTNWVTIWDCAQVTRSFGALPVMAHAKEEVEEMVGLASALVLNIGTLTPEFIDSMIKAGKEANKNGTPIILDAVGAGATKLRTESAIRIIDEVELAVLKGNAGEIAVLAGAEAEVKGVESMGVEGDPVAISKSFAKERDFTVATTGKQDIVSDGKKTYLIDNGHAMMGSLVGTGCMAASVIGCFCAIEKDYAFASASAMACYGIAGELAAKKSAGPGSFKQTFYDEIASLDKQKIDEKIKVRET
ncbi:hydroxyethylthiazole kinase [Candidatus Altiarchaeota archaeon]